MGLMIVGVVLLALKLLGLGPVVGWSWWWVLLPFALAALYWQIADSAGWTQRAAMRRADAKAKRRANERLAALGMRPGRPHRAGEPPRPAHGKPSGTRPSASPFPEVRPPDIGKPPARKE